MEKKLIYLCKSRYDKLNDYEKEHGKISYHTLLEYYDITRILCNKLPEIDSSIWDNVETGSFSYEEDEETYYNEIYQYFIIDLSSWMLDDIKEKYSDELIITYSDLLDNYVLLVDHYGTSWDYVLTDIEFTTDYEKYQEWEKSIKKEDE